MQLFDRATAGAVRRTTDGYLVTDARVARTGMQDYLGSELGRPDLAVVTVYRPESAVFATDAMHSYAHRPVTNDHPNAQVTADTWRDVAIGQTGGDVVRDGEYVRVPLVLMDAGAIAAFDSGKRELSMGYDAVIEFTNGATDGGEKYQAIVTSMKMNHLALVDRARGGENLRIGDSPDSNGGVSGQQQNGGLMAELKKMMVDGLTIETTEQGAQALDKLQKQISDSAGVVQALKDAHSTELAKRDAEIDALKAKVLTDADIQARVVARADLISKAKAVHDADYSGKSDSEIRRMAVAAKVGDAVVAGKPDAYVDARFDILVEDGSTVDPVRDALRDNAPRQNANDNGQTAYEKRLSDSWKTK